MARTRRRSARRRSRSKSGRFLKGGGRRKRSGSRRRRPASRRRKRSHARRPRSRRRHRKTRTRSRGRRGRSRRRPVRYRTYRSLSRKYGPRRAAKKWRRRKKYVRANPFGGLLPSFGSITGVVKNGVAIGLGWVGVNAAMMLVDKIGLAKLKETTSPTVTALINFGARAILTGVVAKLGSRFLKQNGAMLAYGGAFNAVYHGVQDVIAANPTMVPDVAKPLLLGYDGYGDFVTAPGFSDWVTTPGMRGLPYSGASTGDDGHVLA